MVAHFPRVPIGSEGAYAKELAAFVSGNPLLRRELKQLLDRPIPTEVWAEALDSRVRDLDARLRAVENLGLAPQAAHPAH